MSKCLDTKPVIVCFTNTTTGEKTSLIEHIVYQKGAAIAHAYTTHDTETIFDITGGTITVGACLVIPPDVKYTEKCDDILNDGTLLTPYVAQIITNFNANGVAIVPSIVNNLLPDLVTPYTTRGTTSTGKCGCEKQPVLGTITSWNQLSAENDFSNQSNF